MNRLVRAAACTAAVALAVTGIAAQPAAAKPYDWVCDSYNYPRNYERFPVTGFNCEPFGLANDQDRYWYLYERGRLGYVFYCEGFRRNNDRRNSVSFYPCWHR